MRAGTALRAAACAAGRATRSLKTMASRGAGGVGTAVDAAATLPLVALIGWVIAASPLPSQAAGDADVRRMIDALRPAAGAASDAAPARGVAPAGRTRNLVVESVPAAASAPTAGAVAAPAPTPPTTAPPAAPSPPPGAAAAPGGGAPAGLSLAISFEPNSAQLRPENGDLIGALVAAMLSRELRSTRFVIEGHTDATGTPAQNLRLSRERAEQVRLALMTLGVPGERLSAVGKGSSEPANARDPRSPDNRRVRVVPAP
ncbi:MAG: OmpA family protein [Rubrivivax sp.]|nr:OmpA family protein [Rubrivivax sp.]